MEFDPLVGARITRIPSAEPCVHRTCVYNLVPSPPFDWVTPQGTYAACWKNELVALQRRHLLNEGEPHRDKLDRCIGISRLLAGHFSIERPKTQAEVVEHKGSPAARRRYERAFRHVNAHGWSPNMARVAAFVKVEKWQQDFLDLKPPRLIQYRSYEYCAELSRYLLAIEEQLWAFKEKGLCPFAKHMNSFRTAETIVSMAADFEDPVFVLADHSKFDSCVTRPWIWLEHQFYMGLLPSDQLNMLMEMQYFNRCVTKHGIRYECEGRKMSGEYNTSLGDTLINYCILKDVFRHTRHRVLLNGDDSVIVLERSCLGRIDLSVEMWAGYGFKTGWKVVDTIEEVEFCQCSPIQIRPSVWRMVREPKRAISRSLISSKRYQGQAWYSLVAAMGHSEMACGDGVPMMQSWGRALLRAAKGAKPLAGEIARRARHERSLNPESKPIHEVARISFEAAFGIGKDEQLAFEAWADHQQLPVIPALYRDDRQE